MGEYVVKVPGHLRSELVGACKDPDGIGLRIQSDDGDDWEEVPEDVIKDLHIFVAGYFPGAPAKSWSRGAGVRLGWNKEGVFLHESHSRRFFGIRRSSASVTFKAQVADAVAWCDAPKAKAPDGADKTERMLIRMMTELPAVTDEMRKQVLRVTFQSADLNGNGKLSKPEVGKFFRRLVTSMSAREVEEHMREVDVDHNGQVSFDEFVVWLETHAPEKVTEKLKKATNNEADVVKASFRVWDRNGDGLISQRELKKMLGKLVSHFSDKQVDALINLMDKDHDGNVDYEEFVDFLFHSHKKGR